jgi:hypothetical protein
MNAVTLAAAQLLVLSWQASPLPEPTPPVTAKVTGVMVVPVEPLRSEPAPGVRVILMPVRRNAEGLLQPDLQGARDCEEPNPPEDKEPYSFCTAATDTEGRFAFAGVKPGLYVVTSGKEAAARKLAMFGKRVVCELRAGLTFDVGRLEVQK